MNAYTYEFSETSCDCFTQRIVVVHTVEWVAEKIALDHMRNLGWPPEKCDELKLKSCEAIMTGILSTNIEKY